MIGFGGSAGYDSTLNGKVLDLAIREAVDRLVDGITQAPGRPPPTKRGIHHDEDDGAAAPDGVRPYGSRAGDHGIGRPAGACAQQPKSLYTWEGYQPTVYAYLKEDGNDYAVQAQTLEKSVEKARATNRELPPGFRAHLGMLYLKMGDGEKGVEQLQAKSRPFPNPRRSWISDAQRGQVRRRAASAGYAATPAAESVARQRRAGRRPRTRRPDRAGRAEEEGS